MIRKDIFGGFGLRNLELIELLIEICQIFTKGIPFSLQITDLDLKVIDKAIFVIGAITSSTILKGKQPDHCYQRMVRCT